MRFIIEDKKKGTRLPDILRAALHLFVKKGIEATTTKEIAGRAKVAEGALYRHFKSKEALAWYLFATNLNAFTADLLAQAMAAPSTRERIRVVIDLCFEACEHDRDLFYYLIIAEHKGLEKFARTFTHPGQVVMRILAEGQERGEVRKANVHMLASVVIGTLHRMCVIRAYGSIEKPLTDFKEEVLETVWRAVSV